MASKIIVDQLESSGSNITIPTGTGLVVTDGIAATNLSGTIADARLPTVPVTKGGTGLTSLGSAGQAVKVNSAGNALEFGAVAGGKVLQVVNATDSTQRNSTSTSFVTASNTLSVDITPSATSSKIYVVCGFSVYTNGAGHVKYTIYRDSTNLGDATHGIFAAYENDDCAKSHTLTILDSPNSTSQLTYQLYIKGFSGISNHYLNYSGATSSITAFEIGA